MPTERALRLQKELQEERAKEVYVEYLSPGTFVSETTLIECSTPYDMYEAVRGAKKIKERHSTTPYGFHFVDGNHRSIDERTYYITGDVISYDDVPAIEKNSILRSNMQGNDWAYIIENTNSWKITQPFDEKDVVVDWDGRIICRGDESKMMKYRKEFAKRKKEY
jgi:hypothetical protein